MIHVYVDFCRITSTSSPDDALALLISMYTIFELAFDKKSRVVRLIYSILHGDKQYLSNSIRMYIKEKNIDIRCQKIKVQMNGHVNCPIDSTKVIGESQAQLSDTNNSQTNDLSTNPKPFNSNCNSDNSNSNENNT